MITTCDFIDSAILRQLHSIDRHHIFTCGAASVRSLVSPAPRLPPRPHPALAGVTILGVADSSGPTTSRAGPESSDDDRAGGVTSVVSGGNAASSAVDSPALARASYREHPSRGDGTTSPPSLGFAGSPRASTMQRSSSRRHVGGAPEEIPLDTLAPSHAAAAAVANDEPHGMPMPGRLRLYSGFKGEKEESEGGGEGEGIV